VSDLSARRVGDRVEIHFTIPAENADHTEPPAISRVQLYGAAGPAPAVAPAPFAFPAVPLTISVNGTMVAVASTPLLLSRLTPVQLWDEAGSSTAKRAPKGTPPPTTAVALLTSKHLLDEIEVRPAPAAAVEAAPAAAAPSAGGNSSSASSTPPTVETKPTPGSRAAFVEDVAAVRAAAAAHPDASLMRYVVVGAAGGRRLGTPSAVIEIPLTLDLPPPTDLAVTFDETTTKLTWTPGAPLQSFRVYQTDRTGQESAAPLNPAPLTEPAFAAPVEFGLERCYIVRAIALVRVASVESNPAGPACVTPADTFPPPAPTGLSGLPSERQIQLLWTPVAAADLAGYVVLRGEDGGPPAAITPNPVPEASYTDTNLKAGARYTYTVVAVDKAGNRSQPSNTIEEAR
jgi:hypothetical protein